MRVDAHSHAAQSALKKALDVSKSLAETLTSIPGSGSETLATPSKTPVPAASPVPSSERPAFTLSLSPEAREAAERERAAANATGAAATGGRVETAETAEAPAPQAAAPRAPSSASEPSTQQLTPEEQAVVRELQARDAEVRAHEAAHAAAGGALAGSPSYTYTTGPDGRQYATGGEVPISVGTGGTPEERLRNAAQVRAAALAPASPSSADLGVAASATSVEVQARQEIAEARAEEQRAEIDAEGTAAISGEPTAPEIAGQLVAEFQAAELDDATERDDLAAITDPRIQNYGEVSSAIDPSVAVDLFG